MRRYEHVRVGPWRLGVGEIAVLAVLAAFLTTWGLMSVEPRLETARDVLMAAFIGGFTDTVAIRMLFEKRWYLPGSGVLLKERDAIVLSLADTMERHILNPALIEGRVRELTLSLDRERVADLVNAAIDEVRPDLVAFVTAPAQRGQIVAAIEREGGFWGGIANSLGLVTYGVVADRLVAGVVEQIAVFRVDAEMVDRAMEKVGSVDDLFLRPGHPFVVRHYGQDRSLAQILFEKLDAKQLVIDKLSAYDAAQVRDIIADNIAQHLGWLQVFGCLLGGAIAALIELIGWLL